MFKKIDTQQFFLVLNDYLVEFNFIVVGKGVSRGKLAKKACTRLVEFPGRNSNIILSTLKNA